MTIASCIICMKTDKPYNDLIPLPPQRTMIETLLILRQLVNSSVALAELKGLTNILFNPNIGVSSGVK